MGAPFIAGLILTLAAGVAAAAEITVISGGAARAFVEPLAKAFPAHDIKLDWQPMGRLVEPFAAGQRRLARHQAAHRARGHRRRGA